LSIPLYQLNLISLQSIAGQRKSNLVTNQSRWNITTSHFGLIDNWSDEKFLLAYVDVGIGRLSFPSFFSVAQDMPATAKDQVDI
jgi:hypothetical protein